MAATTPIVPETADKAYAITSDKPAMARIERSTVPMFFCMIIVWIGFCSRSVLQQSRKEHATTSE